MAADARPHHPGRRRQPGDALLDQPRPARGRLRRCSRPPPAARRWRWRAGAPTWSCSTSTCPTSTASRSAAAPRRSRDTRASPVIHLSATFVNDVDKVHGLEAGADGYLTHPVEPPVLIATVNAFLRARQAEDAMRDAARPSSRRSSTRAATASRCSATSMIYPRRQPGDVPTARPRPRDEIVGKHLSAFLPPHPRHMRRRGRTRPLATGVVARRAAAAARRRQRRRPRVDTCRSTPCPDIRLAIIADITERTRDRGRARAAAGQRARRARRGRARQPAQGRVPGGAVARAAHAAERHRRLVAGAQEQGAGRRRRPTSSTASRRSSATPGSRRS